MEINSKTFEGKDFEQALLKAEEHFDLSEEEMIITVTQEGSKGILGIGAQPTIIDVKPFSYIVVFAEEYVREMITQIGISDATIDSTFSNNIITITVDSDNNGVLIGKNGRTLNSIVHLVTQALRTQLGEYIKVVVDVGNYKDARIKQLEQVARNVSRSVAKTKVEAKLEPMNSYERRIIHEYLSNDRFVFTTSEGEEPKRYVVIKLKK